MKNKVFYAKELLKITETVHSRRILPENMCGEMLSSISASSCVPTKAAARLIGLYPIITL